MYSLVAPWYNFHARISVHPRSCCTHLRVKHPWENTDAEGLSSARSEAGATSVGEFDGDSVYDDSRWVHSIASG